MKTLQRSALLLPYLLSLPLVMYAQSATTGAIAGVVKDATGAVLPGVTVEAASPALIERLRTVVTDSQGNYKIVDLRPGTYSVTFTLTGFSTFKRDGLPLTTGITASVNAEMRLGSLEETVTVTGASPVVDVQNVRTQNVLSHETLDALPTAKTLESYAALTLGATFSTAAHQDVGGNQGEAGGYGGWIVHGNRANDQRITIDGMHFSGLLGEGAASNKTNFVNQLTVEETTIQTSGASADTETGGVRINIVPKDGGNTFKGAFAANGTGSSLQSNNLTGDLVARGIATPPNVKQIYDVGAGFGGRILRDRLWFYTAHRWWGSQNTAPGIYFNATPHTLTYTPDLSRPGYTDFPHRSNDVRLTWQVSARNKVTMSEGVQLSCSCFYNIERGGAAPEATDEARYLVSITQGTWSYPRTNRLLFEAGNSTSWERDDEGRVPGVLPTDVSVTELSTGFVFGSKAGVSAVDYGPGKKRHQSNQRFAVSYVTGSHAFKTGFTLQEGWGKLIVATNDIPGLGPVSYQLRFGLPVQLTEFSSPNHFRYRLMPNLGIYAQDQWTLKRLTLNYGLRYDHVREYVPAETVAAIPAFGIPERTFAEANDVPLWSDLSPRLGAAYDLFGNARTAVKASLGRYVGAQVAGLGFANAPASRIATQATRTWVDANGNFFPDCALTNPDANGECGRLSNVNLGLSIPATNYDPNYLHGWRVRDYNWQAAAILQHELRPGIAVNVGYFRTWYGNFTAVANQAVAPSDFSSYCVTAPTDARLGVSNGRQLCGLYDVNPARFGQVSNLVQLASNFGQQYEHYNGIDVALNARFGKGGLLQSGVSTGNTVTDNCAIVQSNPQIALTVAGGAGPRASTDFCHVVNPWSAQTQYKFVTNYPLPWWDVRVSGTYQNLPGIPIAAINVFTSAQIAPSLGRNLAAGAAGTATVALMVPNTAFEDRINQVDLRFTKIFRIGRYRAEGDFDIYNAFNASPILGDTTVYGPNWLKPTAILGARLLKFGVQVDF